MSAFNLSHRLMDTVVATDLDHPDQDFVDAAGSLLALAISRLEPAKREDVLRGIEFGTLRRSVGQFLQIRRQVEFN